MARVVVGNKREVPNQLPVLEWMDRVEAYVAQPDILAELPWYDPVMEYLRPDELIKLRAKALVWAEETKALPSDVSVWWEVRMGRRRGDVPSTTETTKSRIDETGVLHCGYCQARWSANFDGSPHPSRCKLCDRIFVIEKEHKDYGDVANERDQYRCGEQYSGALPTLFSDVSHNG